MATNPAHVIQRATLEFSGFYPLATNHEPLDFPMTRRTFELIAFFAALLLAAMAFHAWLAAHDEQQRLAATLAAQKQLLDAADARERDRNSALSDTLAQIAKLKSAALSPQQIIRELPQYLPLPQPITLANSPAPNSAASSPAVNLSSPTRAAGGEATFQASPGGLGRDDEESAVLPSSVTDSTASAPPSSPTSQSRASQSIAKGTARLEDGEAAPSASTAASASGSSASSTSSASSASASLPSAPAAQIPAADLQPLFDFVQDCRACQARLAVAQENAADDAAKITALTRERDAALTAAKGGSFLRRLRRNALWFGIGAGVGYALAKR